MASSSGYAPGAEPSWVHGPLGSNEAADGVEHAATRTAIRTRRGGLKGDTPQAYGRPTKPLRGANRGDIAETIPDITGAFHPRSGR